MVSIPEPVEETRKDNPEAPVIRVEIDFSVQGEGRFLSHHDMMRLMTHAVGRAKLPLRFSQGFNPRPKMSLPFPRPVGVASHVERLLVELSDPMTDAEVVRRLAAQMPPGIELTGGRILASRQPPQARTASYTLAVDAPTSESLRRRLAELSSQARWPVTRPARREGKPDRHLDLRQLIGSLDVEGQTVSFTLTRHNEMWASVDEVLVLLGLEELHRAQLVRTDVQWDDDAAKPRRRRKRNRCQKKC